MRISRRDFIYFLVLGSAGGVASYYLSRTQKLPVDEIFDLQGALALGKEYLLHYPDEKDNDRLVSVLFNDFTPQSVYDLQTYIKNKIQTDFEQSNTSLLKGWLLSRTEARFCALANMTDYIDIG